MGKLEILMILHAVFSFKAVFSASGVGLGLEWAIEIEHLGLFYVGNSKWSSWC